jgi:hypothetical protein
MPSELRAQAYSPVTMTRLRWPEMARRCQSRNCLAVVSGLTPVQLAQGAGIPCHVRRSLPERSNSRATFSGLPKFKKDTVPTALNPAASFTPTETSEMSHSE